jgi:hypothetical protein
LLDRAKVLYQSVGFDDEVPKTMLHVLWECDGFGKHKTVLNMGNAYSANFSRIQFRDWLTLSSPRFNVRHFPQWKQGARMSGQVPCSRDDENRKTEKNGWRTACERWTNFGTLYSRPSLIDPERPLGW